MKSHCQLVKDTVDIWTQSLLPKSTLFIKLLSTNQSVSPINLNFKMLSYNQALLTSFHSYHPGSAIIIIILN